MTPLRGHRPFEIFVIAVLVVIPIVLPLVPDTSSELYVILAFVGLIVWLARDPHSTRRVTHEERIAALGCAAFSASIIISVIEVGATYDAVRELDVLLRPLLAISILLLLVRIRPTSGVLWIPMAVGALAVGFNALYHHFSADSYQRVEGAIGAISYGRASLALGFIAAVGLPYFRRLGRAWAWVPSMAFAMGLAGTILSGSRGVWIAVPALLPLLLWNFWHPAYRRVAVVAVTGIVLAFALSVAVPQTGVQNRIDQAVSQVKLYLDDPAKHGGTSVGQRFEMWRAAWSMFVQDPIFGGGTGDSFNRFLRSGIEAGHYHPNVGVQTQVHNVFLQALASRGLVGLAGLMVFWLALTWVYWKATRRDDDECRSLGIAGLGLILVYAVSGLTDSAMSYGRPLTFFCLESILIVHLIAERSLPNGALGSRGKENSRSTVSLVMNSTTIMAKSSTRSGPRRSRKATFIGILIERLRCKWGAGRAPGTRAPSSWDNVVVG